MRQVQLVRLFALSELPRNRAVVGTHGARIRHLHRLDREGHVHSSECNVRYRKRSARLIYVVELSLQGSIRRFRNFQHDPDAISSLQRSLPVASQVLSTRDSRHKRN